MRGPRVLLLALAVLVAGCDLLGGGGTSVVDLVAGDCFDDATDETGQVGTVELVDCAEEHDNEVFHVFTATGDSFPGDGVLTEQAQQQCLPTFEAYVGAEYATSALEVVPIVPTERGWAEGDRGVVCVLSEDGGAPLVGSMQGAER